MRTVQVCRHASDRQTLHWSQTVNNDNSSRFAKCMQICFTDKMSVCGAEIQTSLLEKGRVRALSNEKTLLRSMP